MSLLKRVAEEARQALAQDAKFWQNYLYFFELFVPAEALWGSSGDKTTSMIFPLVLNPQTLNTSEPFALSATSTVNAGLFLEENGIIARTITIEGHTGFKPRAVKSTGLAKSEMIKTDHVAIPRRGVATPLDVSGQRHFQFLQDRVFRTYSELKKDPATARETRMAFHNVRDDEHWYVAPVRFDMHRDVRSRFLYRYSIELLAYDLSSSSEVILPGEDKGILDRLRDVVASVKAAIDDIISVIQDVQGLLQSIENVVNGFVDAFTKLTSIVSAGAAFIEGAADFITIPFRAVINTADAISDLQTRLDGLPARVRDTINNSLNRAKDACHRFANHRDRYQAPLQEKLAQLGTATSRRELEAAAAAPPTSLNALAKLGTKPMAGDLRRRQTLTTTRRTPSYASAFTHNVAEEDSLPGLAARFLGRADEWRAIAALNDLVPPYVSRTGLPGTVRPGDSIMIPSTARPPSVRVNDGIVGADPNSGLEVQQLGVDLLVRDGDFVVSVDATDIKTVRGVPNLEQALTTRLSTERGTDVLYRSLGYDRMVGIGVAAVDAQIAQLRLRDAVLADPRVARVVGVQTDATTPLDVASVDLTVQVRGLNQTVTASAPVRI